MKHYLLILGFNFVLIVSGGLAYLDLHMQFQKVKAENDHLRKTAKLIVGNDPNRFYVRNVVSNHPNKWEWRLRGKPNGRINIGIGQGDIPGKGFEGFSKSIVHERLSETGDSVLTFRIGRDLSGNVELRGQLDGGSEMRTKALKGFPKWLEGSLTAHEAGSEEESIEIGQTMVLNRVNAMSIGDEKNPYEGKGFILWIDTAAQLTE